jgi:hypothetical protein
MKTLVAKHRFPLVILTVLLIVYSCHKDYSASNTDNIPAGKMNLSLYLTDGPLDFQKVLVDIQSVQVLVDTCKHSGDEDDNEEEGERNRCFIQHHREGGDDNNQGDDNAQGDEDSQGGGAHDSCTVWENLKIHPGVYDLLSLRNGVDTLLGSTFIPKGRIIAVKLTIGKDDSVVVDSITHPIHICNDTNFVIICLRHQDIDSISQNNFHLLVDFNLARSINFTDSMYCLKPELRVFSQRLTGSIEGDIRPEESFGLVKAFNSTDTAFGLPNDDEGEFKIRGLNPGTYSVSVQGTNGFADTTITGVIVTAGDQTNIGVITLHH